MICAVKKGKKLILSISCGVKTCFGDINIKGEFVHFFLAGNWVQHLGPGTFPHPAAPNNLSGHCHRPAGPPQPRPAGGALPQPLCLAGLQQLQQGQGAGRPAWQHADQQPSTAGQNEQLSGPRHGLPGQQHAAQLAGRALLSTNGSWRDARPVHVIVLHPPTESGAHGSGDGAAKVTHYSCGVIPFLRLKRSTQFVVTGSIFLDTFYKHDLWVCLKYGLKHNIKKKPLVAFMNLYF